MKVYIEPRDWWIGYYRGPNHHYVCPIPCVVIRWPHKAWRGVPFEIYFDPEQDPKNRARSGSEGE